MPIIPTAVIAFILLALIDGFLITVALLGNVEIQIIFMIACLTATFLAFLLKFVWLIYLAQTFVVGLLVYRSIQSLQLRNIEVSDNGTITVITFIAILVFGYFLAWLITRAVPLATKS